MNSRRNLSRCLILLPLTALAFAGQPADKSTSEEVTVADRIRTAFYEVAPRSIAASMRKAVKELCAAREQKVGRLCSGRRLAYLREVLVNGYKTMDGYVCDAEVISPSIKYYVGDMIGPDMPCLHVWYDDDLKKHTVDATDESEPQEP